MAEPAKIAPITITPSGDDVETGFTKVESEFDASYGWIGDIGTWFKSTVAPSTVWEGLKWHKSGITPEELWEYTSGDWVKLMDLNNSSGAGMRQCILTGPADVSGNPACVVAGTGLACNLVGLIIGNFAAGYDGVDPLDYRTSINSVTSAWSGLPATQTIYLYIDRNSSTGAITYGYSTVKPLYQRHAPAHVAGLHWFNGDKMQYSNGSTWSDQQRVFAASCVTGVGSVASVNVYPYRDWWNILPASEIINTPAGSIAATTVQAAINELDETVQAAVNEFDKLVFEQTLSAAQTSITFTSLDGNAAKGYVLHFNIQNTAASPANTYIYVNGDTTNGNYIKQVLAVSSATVTAATASNPGLFATTNAYGCNGFIEIDITPTGEFWAQCYYHSNGLQWGVSAVKKTATIANITSITMTNDVANSIGINSKFTLYRRC